MDLASKIQKLEKKLNAIEVPAGAATSATAMSVPVWVDWLTPWLEFTVLVCGAIVGVFTVIIYGRKVFRNDSKTRR